MDCLLDKTKEKERNQKIFTFEKLKSKNVAFVDD